MTLPPRRRWSLRPEKSRGDAAQNVRLSSVRFRLTWHRAPSHRIIRALSLSGPSRHPSVESWGGGGDFHVNRSLLLLSAPPFAPPDALSPALCRPRSHLPLPAVASPNTQSGWRCVAAPPPHLSACFLPPSPRLSFCLG